MQPNLKILRLVVLLAAGSILLGYLSPAMGTEPYQTKDPTAEILRDFARYSEYDRTYIRYFTFEHIESEALAKRFADVLKFVVPSCSREVLLDRQIPSHFGHNSYPHVYKIDLRDLGWTPNDFLTAVHEYPYSYAENPLIIRGDWFVYRVTETKTSKAYYHLLYGSSLPKNRDDFLQKWGVDRQKQRNKKLDFGVIEEESGVALAKERWIEHYESDGGYAWGTRDSKQITSKSSPNANPTGNFQHDGEEWIIGIPKISTYKAVRGTLQAYLLANGQGVIVEEGPVDLVEDFSRFKGQSSVRTWGSCVQCHVKGINEPTTNGIKAIISDGVDIYKDKAEQEFIDRFHLGDTGKEILRNQEDYTDIIEACNGLSPAENAAYFREATLYYPKTMSYEQVAAELYTTPEILQNALAYSSELESTKKLPFALGIHLSRLAHEKTLERTLFEEYYHRLRKVLEIWHQK